MTRPDWLSAGKTRTSLSISVELQDAVTGRLVARPRVELHNRPETFTRTPSGYFVLPDLSGDAGPVDILVDGSPWYLPETETIEAEDLAAGPVIETIELLPAPAYRFPANATLVRGSITDDESVPNATVSIETTDIDGPHEPAFAAAGRSDARGEFVLFLTGLTANDIIESYEDASDAPSDRLVHVDGKRPVVRAVHPDNATVSSQPVILPAGTTVNLDLAF